MYSGNTSVNVKYIYLTFTVVNKEKDTNTQPIRNPSRFGQFNVVFSTVHLLAPNWII
jgi:hypothetical protein